MNTEHFSKAFIFKSTAILLIFSAITLCSFSQTDKLYRSLEYINVQFQKYNTYNLQYQLDIAGKNLKSSSKYFEVTYPLEQLSTIYYTKRGDKDCVVYFKCKDDVQCIKSYDIDYKTSQYKSENSVNLESNTDIADKVIMEFMAIKNGINITNSNVNQNLVTGNSDLNSDLDYINRMMKLYNPYNLQYTIDWDRKVLQSRSTYFEVTYYPLTLKPVELVSRGVKDYTIKFTCNNNITCLISIDIGDQKTELKDNYSVNFNGNEQEAQKMINTFNHILQNLR